MIEESTFQKKTFQVRAVQVSRENIAEVAEWCGGTLAKTLVPTQEGITPVRIYIAVPVKNATVPELKAFVGNWIARIGGSKNFRVYSDQKFKELFEMITPVLRRRKLIKELLEEHNEAGFSDFHDANYLAGLIMDLV